MNGIAQAIARAKALADRYAPARFEAKSKDSVGELYVYDAIGGGLFGEGVTPKSVAEALSEMKGVKTLNVYVNSPGGDVFDGVAIYNQIRRFDAQKVVHIDGIAASAASMIAMAGDEIVMAHNAQMMIHEAWGMAIGNAEAMRGTADLLEKVTAESVLQSYARTGQSTEQLRAWMKAETWMNATEAKQRKFCDRIDGVEQDAPAHAAASASPLVAALAATQARIRSMSQRMADADQDKDARRIFERASAASRGGAPGQPGLQSTTDKRR